MKTKFLAFVLILALTLSLALSGCSESSVTNLSEGVTADQNVVFSGLKCGSESYADFASNLFVNCFEAEGNENTLVSPLSVALAFAMVAEGADVQTLAEIESVFGMDINEIRQFAYSYMYPKVADNQLTASNSLWINDAEDFKVKADFLQRNADYHKADIFKTKFSRKTVEEINEWVNEKTDGTIDKIVDNLDERSVMCLINALIFDAKWETPYNEHQVEKGEFVRENGETQTAEYLFNSEYLYLEDENAKGFIKCYEGGNYAFAAMLPDEGVSVEEYVISLNGEKLGSLLENPKDALVYTSIPKFEYKTDLNLKSVLYDMGLEKAFDEEKADFSKLGQIQGGNIWIGDVLHSTKISVTENGTQAGAATAVVLYGNGGAQDFKEVFLTRPFVYMIIDMENNLPVFMGTVMSLDN